MRLFFAAAAVMLVAPNVWAQQVNTPYGGPSVSSQPIYLIMALAAMALVPLLLIMVTSFVKVAVVLSIVRQAIGTPQIPPTTVLTGMSIIMSVYIMSPVALEAYYNGQERIVELGYKELTLKKIEPKLVTELVGIGQVPLREFLRRNSDKVEVEFFHSIAVKMRTGFQAETITRDDYSVVTPAFVLTELKEAFIIGFIFFMPFLAIDMVVANILMALGMQMLSPNTISMPFKILLIVVADGWHLLAKGLVLGYGGPLGV